MLELQFFSKSQVCCHTDKALSTLTVELPFLCRGTEVNGSLLPFTNRNEQNPLTIMASVHSVHNVRLN